MQRRGDIDGLRAVAVVAVVGFHAFPAAIAGGFAGVDVFFVISGFLISRIILAELDAGSFRFAAFYIRRLRRIVPSLVVVLAACLVAGWFLLFGDEYAGLGKHAAGGAGFVSNLVLWDEVGYFDVSAATKPLLHLWSLGIEEQFYFAWPLLLWIGWHGRRIGAPAITLVLIIGSFGVQLAMRGDDAFYLPQARLWELLIGAALAQRPRAGGGDVTCGVGLAAIATSFVVGGGGAWMLLPTIGTALAIAAGDQTWLARRVLARPLATWIGRISYPLYLWHWPILVFLRILDGETPSLLQRVIAIAAAVGLAEATRRFVEVPIQRGPARRLHVLGLGAALLAVGCAGFYIFAHDGLRSRAIERSAPGRWAITLPPSPGCYAAHPFAHGGGCYDSPEAHPETLMLVGDSQAEALAPGFLHARLTTNLRIITRAGCMPFLHVEYVAAGDRRPYHCREVIDGALEEALADRRVTTVVLVARHASRLDPGASSHFELDDGTRTPAEVFRRALVGTVAALQARGIRVVFVDQVPELDFDPRDCMPRPLGMGRRTPASCGVPLAAVVERQRPYRALVDAALPAGVVRVDPLPLFCRDQICSAWLDGELVYHDDNHLGPAGADALAAEILARLR